MKNYKIILSSGSVPWFGIEKAVKLAYITGFDGIELLPTRKVCAQISIAIQSYGHTKWIKHIKGIEYIQSLHHSWRLDNGLDTDYGITGIVSWVLFPFIRFIFFPHIETSIQCLSSLSQYLHVPLTIHNLDKQWLTMDNKKPYQFEIWYEIVNRRNLDKKSMKIWLKNSKHKIVLDTRDDQSLMWAKSQVFKGWKDFWNWIGVNHIGAVQVTLIGRNGMKNILERKPSLAEEQLLFLHKKQWKGSVVMEVNIVVLFLLTKGRITHGLKTLSLFVETVLGQGKKWS